MTRAQAVPPPRKEPSLLPIDEKGALSDYLKDASHFRGKADRIAFPDSEEEVAQILRDANRKSIPVTISGAGTGLTGARVPQGGILLSTERMNKILKIQWDDRAQEGFVVLEPGVTLRELEETLESRGLFYPPNPGEKKAFLGGTVATNASGSRSFKYGSTRRHVRRVRVILANGDRLELFRGGEVASGGRFSLLLSNGKEIQVPLPTYLMPPVKSAAGYYAAAGMELLDLFVGSEGTLGLFTEIELKILKKPASSLSGIFFFPSEKECYRFSTEVRRLGREEMTPSRIDPRALEFFDSRSLKLLRKKEPTIPLEAGAALFFEQECRKGDVEMFHQRWIVEAERFTTLTRESWIASDAKGQQFFREFRYNLPVLVNEEVARNSFRKIGTDMAVPDETAEEMFDFYLEELGRSGMEWVLFGHIGENHLHANLLPKTAQEFERAGKLYDLFAQKAIALGGTISAEHGIGKVRIPYLERMVGTEGLKQMARVKLALDPHKILNPGNIIPANMLNNSSASGENLS